LHLIIVIELSPRIHGTTFVIFCQFITLPHTATICLWISAGRSPFVLRNRMTECISHLVGLWIGTAVSNTSHSNKAGSTTVKMCMAHRYRTKVDGSVAAISIINFSIGLHVMYLYFPDTPGTV
jgi:hypothetical protein